MTDKAFQKGLKTLVALAESNEPQSLGSLSSQLNLTKSNTHRLLNTLIENGLAERDDKRGYYKASLRLWELGVQIVNRIDFLGTARKAMSNLVETTGETVHLSILVGAEVVYIDKKEGTQAVRSYTEIGGRAPACWVATGKVLLAFLDEYEFQICCDKLIALAPDTLDIQLLQKELAEVRRTNSAFNWGDWRRDVVGAAAPIRDSTGCVVAAIGISGPSVRLKAQLPEKSKAVKACALEISGEMGWMGKSF